MVARRAVLGISISEWLGIIGTIVSFIVITNRIAANDAAINEKIQAIQEKNTEQDKGIAKISDNILEIKQYIGTINGKLDVMLSDRK